MKIEFISIEAPHAESRVVSSTKVLKYFSDNPEVAKSMRDKTIIGHYAHSYGGPMPHSVWRSLYYSEVSNKWERTMQSPGFSSDKSKFLVAIFSKGAA